MTTFVFQLDAALRLRERAEADAQRLLAERLAVSAEFRRQARQLDESLRTARSSLRDDGHLTGAVDVAFLASHRRFTGDVHRRGGELVRRLALAERDVAAARERLAEAATARRVLERLREKRHDEWKQEQAHREQVEADDATSAWLTGVSEYEESKA
jgi:flagellar export protein FliJ